jgi:hypothetical protein
MASFRGYIARYLRYEDGELGEDGEDRFASVCDDGTLRDTSSHVGSSERSDVIEVAERSSQTWLRRRKE